MNERPDVLLIVADDLGFSDLGCYGSELDTPVLDRLAAGGIRMSQFYNTARCSPSRASLLTGLHPHQTGIGVLTSDDRPNGYRGSINERCVTIAEVLRAAGYATSLSGKWHLTGSHSEPDDAWPTRRGFDQFFGTILGAGSYWNPESLHCGEIPVSVTDLPEDFYYTDAISDHCAGFIRTHARSAPQQPLFAYAAFTAPHWPLHAPAERIAEYRGRFDVGWDELRARRTSRLVADGLIDPEVQISDRDPLVPPWTHAPNPEHQARLMEVYAAQVSAMDAGIGRIITALEETGRLDNTLIMFLSDNGGSAEELGLSWTDEVAERNPVFPLRTRDGQRVLRGNAPGVEPGGDHTYASYGRAWSNLSNAPFREHKSWTHEGGIATPFIAHWPPGLTQSGVVRHTPHQLTDVMATVLEVTATRYPRHHPGRDLLPPEGVTMVPTWRGESDSVTSDRTLYWEHLGNAAVRRGRYKLVRRHPDEWELFDISVDRTERHDLAADLPDVVAELATAYEAWAHRCGVLEHSPDTASINTTDEFSVAAEPVPPA